MTDVEQSFQLVVDFLRRKGFVSIATKLENSERVKIGKLSNAPTRLEALLVKGHAFEQEHPEEQQELDCTPRGQSQLGSVNEETEIQAPVNMLEKKVKSKAKQMGLSKSMNNTFFRDIGGNISSSLPRSNAPVVSVVSRDSSKIIVLPSRLDFRHSREPHTPLRTLNKQRRATSATVARPGEEDGQNPDDGQKSDDKKTDDDDEYSNDEDIGFRLTDSILAKIAANSESGPINRGNIEIYPKITTNDTETDSDTCSTKESDDDSDEVETPKSHREQMFPMELEESAKPIGINGKPVKKKVVRTIITSAKDGLQKTEQISINLKTSTNSIPPEKPSLTLSRDGKKPSIRKKTPRSHNTTTTEPDFSECNILSNAGDPKLEYFNLKIVYQERHTGFEELRDFPIKLHDIVAGRYEITGYIGSAAFSRAVHCLDHRKGTKACMKIIKNNKDFFDQCLDELKLLKYIKANGDTNKYHVLEMYDYFYFKEHLFIVCELLLDNLYEFYKKNMQNPDEPTYFTLPRVQKVTQQCLIALQYIHSLGLIHCDLKPENILMKNVENCEIKVIDFGSSCYTTDVLSTYVQSRSYRAPEVILGLPYGQKIDMWSLGCILAELLTGRVIFQNYSVVTLLARIIGIIGPIPEAMMNTGVFVSKYFTEDGELFENTEILTPKRTTLQRRVKTDDQLFLDFLRQLLTIDPAKRLSATDALQHPWLKKVY